MRILIAGMSSTLGGMERRMEAEGLFLKSMGHEVIIATPDFPGRVEWAQHLGALSLKHVVWSPYKVFERMHLMWPFVLYANSTAQTINNLKIDFSLVCVPWNFVGMTMANILTDLGIPYALAIHIKLTQQHLTQKAGSMLQNALKGCMGVYGVSEPVTQSFKNLYMGLVPEKCLITTVSNGVDTKKFNHNEVVRVKYRDFLGISSSDRIIIICGRLDPIKRPLLAIESFIALANKNSLVYLLIVGSGGEQLAMKTLLKQSGFESRAVFVGHVADTSSYFAASDCYLSTSLREGNPLTAAEAASSGLPLVLTDDDVNRSIYSQCEAAIFCNASSADAWASVLQNVLEENKSRQSEVRSISRNFAVNHLSLESMEASLRNFYRSVLEIISR